ncbi:MAG: STM4012 family radical SAM protein [Myxococcota bacterium]
MNVPAVSAPVSKLERMLLRSLYQQYLYAYPHKTAYRALAPPRPLGEVWAHEPKDALFLYVHVPFCEMRCGFCNLFTAANPVEDVVELFLAALEREARATREAVGSTRFARAAVGGGTPTFLEVPQLERVFSLMRDVMGAGLGRIPMSVEVSPETSTRERLAVVRQAGADRISIGVQSFVEAEVAAVKRPQRREDVARALDAIRDTGVPTLNVDLIYGIEGQTEASLVESLRAALRWKPEELYLYPLYVRPLTFLGRSARDWDDHRLTLYRTGRDVLRSEGYHQVSMRMFRKGAPAPSDTTYRCQEDGMVGLGVGARSYTRALHYSHEWAVASRAVRGIIDAYAQRSSADFSYARHGFELSGEEQRRRWVILSLLAEGVDAEQYRARFGTELERDFPELDELPRLDFARWSDGRLCLTESGVERSDVIGPWLHSCDVDEKMRTWEAR